MNAVELPNKSWRNEKSIVEFRHILTCASLIEVQVDSMKTDGNLIVVCCYCGLEDADVNKRIQGCRPMRNEFLKNKEVVKASATKAGERRTLSNVVNRNRSKRARTTDQNASTCVSTHANELQPDSSKEAPTNTNLNVHTSLEDVFKKFIESHELEHAACPGIGDCCAQASMESYSNRLEDFSTLQEKNISKLKWILSNIALNNNATIEGDKHDQWRGHRV